MSSVKCPQCGLVNFAGEEKCKRCESDLAEVAEDIKRGQAAVAEAARHPNLSPCPDCGHMVSRQAESCPQCGRFFQRFKVVVDRAGWAGTIALGIFLIFILFALVNILLVVLLVGSRR
jgi:uncharacterized OB-fold protein